MGDPIDIPSSSNPSNPPSDMATLENALTSFVSEMRVQVAKIKENLNKTRSMTNRRLNELEHPELSLQRNGRSPSQEIRPSQSPRHRSMPLPPYQPPYIPEHRIPPPLPEYGYPPPGYHPYSPEPRMFPLKYKPRPHEFRQPFEEHPYQCQREWNFRPNPHRDQGYRHYKPK